MALGCAVLQDPGGGDEAVLGGRVRLNGERVKPAKHVHSTDVVEVKVAEARWTITVLEVADKRGSARIAATLFEETAESMAERKRGAEERRLSRPPGTVAGGPRPTKRTGGESRRYAESGADRDR